MPVSTGPVSGRHYRSPGARACMVVQAATGIQQERYRSLALHFAAQGISVITYDYSGTGSSKGSHAGRCRRSPSVWGREDQSAVLDYARGHYPEVPLVLLGHSVGGQIVGFSDRVHSLDGLVLVSAQSPYVGHWIESAMRTRVSAIWFGLFPGACKVFGYLPGRVYGGCDLSRQAVEEGRRWARRESALLDEPGVRARLAGLELPLRSYSFSDDRLLAPKEAVDALTAAFERATVERMHLYPASVGMHRIGHVGFFGQKSAPLWDDLVAWVHRVEHRATAAG